MNIRSHKDLIIYQKAFQAAMEIFILTKGFPKEEHYSLIDQIRRSSRSVAANLGEAFRKRQYPKMFIARIIDCESEAA
jgi:four helix bundle protein